MTKQSPSYPATPAEGKTRGERRRETRRAAKIEAQDLTRHQLERIVTLGVQHWVQEVGYEGLTQALETETTAVCGPKGLHDREREAVRYGHVRSSVFASGRRVAIVRPRVRAADGTGEIVLSVLTAARDDPDGMTQAVMGLALGGTSQRGYKTSVEAIEGTTAGAERSVFGPSRSNVNRYFVAATAAVVEEFHTRPLTGGEYRVVFMDGIGFGDHLVVAAVGVRDDGTKEVLGLREGSTEHHEAIPPMKQRLRAMAAACRYSGRRAASPPSVCGCTVMR